MADYIVIDSTIMCDAFLNNDNVSSVLKETCNRIVFSFSYDDNDYYIVLDSSIDNGEFKSIIMDEYRDNLSGIRDFEILFKKLYANDKVKYVSPAVDESISDSLINNHFHEKEDHIFVFTALASNKIIVTEDSDYGIDANANDYNKCSFRYLTEVLELRILNAHSFWENQMCFASSIA